MLRALQHGVMSALWIQALLVHTVYFCPAGTIQLLMVRHPRSLVVGGGRGDNFFLACFGILRTYSQLRPPRATAAQSGGVWAAPRRTGAGDSDTELFAIEGVFAMLGICAVLPRCG